MIELSIIFLIFLELQGTERKNCGKAKSTVSSTVCSSHCDDRFKGLESLRQFICTFKSRVPTSKDTDYEILFSLKSTAGTEGRQV